MSTRWACCALLGIGVLVSAAGALHPAGAPDAAGPQEPTFLSAEHTRLGAIEFRSPVPMDWRQLAAEHFRDFDPERPDSAGVEIIRSHYRELWGSSFVPFSAPLPEALAGGFYYLIGPNGIRELTDLHLEGNLVYSVPLGGSGTPLGPDYHGAVQATLPGVPAAEVRGGFAVRLDAPWPEDSRAAAEAARAEALRHSPRLDSLMDEARFRTAVLEYVFSLGDPSVDYVFRQWADDLYCWEACCVHRYDLRRSDDLDTVIAATAYGCDV